MKKRRDVSWNMVRQLLRTLNAPHEGLIIHRQRHTKLTFASMYLPEEYCQLRGHTTNDISTASQVPTAMPNQQIYTEVQDYPRVFHLNS